MNMMSYKGFQARIEFDESDEILVGRIAGIQDVIGFHGDSVAALKAAFHEAVDDYLEACARIGKTPQKPHSGKVMFRIDPEIHRKAAIAAELSGKSLNQWAEEALSRAVEQKDDLAEARSVP